MKGKGALVVPQKYCYIGEFNHVPHGKGRFYSYEHRAIYDGHFERGKMEGEGFIKSVDGEFDFQGRVEHGTIKKGILTVYDK